MRTLWEARFLDGRTAACRNVTVQLTRTGLGFTLSDGRAFWWPYAEIRQTQGGYVDEPVRLEHGNPPEVLVIDTPSFLSAAHQIAPNAPFHNPGTRRRRALLTVVALGALCAVLGGAYFWLLPAAAGRLARHVPLAWEERLGDAVLDQLAPIDNRCTGAPGLQAIDMIMERLKGAAPGAPYAFRVVVVNTPIVNALTAPGGRIVVFRGLLATTQAPEEFAGVLAHEMAHAIAHHPTRAIIQHASTGLAIAALTGDASGAMAYSLQAAHTLGRLQYSRQLEEEADQEGVRILRAAGISPAGLIRFLEATQKERGRTPAMLRYLSSHPDTPARIEQLRALENTPSAAPILDATAWKAVQRMCPEPASGSDGKPSRTPRKGSKAS